MNVADEGTGGLTNLVTYHPHTFGPTSTLVMGWVDRGAGRLCKLFEHVGCAWSCDMINIFWQEFLRGGGLGRMPSSALYGAEGSPLLCGAQWSLRSNTMVASPLVHSGIHLSCLSGRFWR